MFPDRHHPAPEKETGRLPLGGPSLLSSLPKVPRQAEEKQSDGLRRAPRRKVSFNFACDRFWFRPGCRPEPDEILGEVAHAGAPEAFTLRGLLEGGNHRAALDVVAPQLDLQTVRRPVVIRRPPDFGTNFFLPILSLLHMPLEVIENHLLAAVQTHDPGMLSATRPGTMANAGLSPALHFCYFSC